MHCKRCTELAGTEFQSVMESLSHHCDAVSNLNLVTEERVVLTAIALMAPGEFVTYKRYHLTNFRL